MQIKVKKFCKSAKRLVRIDTRLSIAENAALEFVAQQQRAIKLAAKRQEKRNVVASMTLEQRAEVQFDTMMNRFASLL